MTLYTNIDSNKRKTAFYLGFFLLFVVAFGWLLSRVLNTPAILYIAITISIIQALISYYSGDKIALAVSGAREIQEKDNQTLWHIIENLCITAGLPMPKVYIISDSAPNAFATGRDPRHASIAVTTGLLKNLNKNEIQGVVAHELSHVGNYDIRLMMVVVVIVGVITLMSDLFLRWRIFGFGGRDSRDGGGQAQVILLIIAILAAILAPIAAMLIQLAISRKREFLADSSGALLTRYPEGLASALEKLGSYNRPMRRVSSATSHLFIASPLGAKKKMSGLFSTHPPIEERVAILRGIKV